MKISLLPFTRLVVTSVVGIGVASCLLLPQSSLAQTNGPIPISNTDPQNADDLFLPSNNEQGTMGVFDLIHRAQLGNLPWNSAEQNEQLNSEVDQFLIRRQQLLQGQPQKNQNSEVVTPQLVTPEQGK